MPWCKKAGKPYPRGTDFLQRANKQQAFKVLHSQKCPGLSLQHLFKAISEKEMLEVVTGPAAAAWVSNAPLFSKKIRTHALCVAFCFPKEKLNLPQCFHKLKMNGFRTTIDRGNGRRHLAEQASAGLLSPQTLVI